MRTIRLIYFPTCYPDEDIRSISYRYHLHSGNRNTKQSTIDLFELTHRQCIIPENISILFERLPKNSLWSQKEFLQNHSFYPLFKPFLNEKHRLDIETLFTNPNYKNGSMNLQFSRLNNKLTTEIVRYCPTCLLEDYERLGECYLHRLHQIVDVDVCHKHHTTLIICCPDCLTLLSDPKKDTFLSTPYCQNGHLIKEDSSRVIESLELKLALLRDYEFLLTNVNDKVCDDVKEILRITMLQRVPSNRKGVVSKKGFIEEFSKCITSEMHKHFKISKELMFEKPIFRRLLKANLFLLHPNLFIFMVQFLVDSLDNFLNMFNNISETRLIGSGPWNCLNKLCIHYQEPVITNFEPYIQACSYIEFGNFKCDFCGFIYSLGWDKRYQKNVRFRIKDRGRIWEKTVLDHFHSGMPIYKIAKILETHPAAIKKVTDKLNSETNYQIINEINLAKLQVAATQEIDGKIAYHREKLLHKLELYPNLTRSDVKDWATITWLRAHDKEWYELVLPQKKKTGVFNYDELDNLLAIKIQEAVNKLNISKPNRRIKKDTIINLLDKVDRNRLRIKKQILPKSWSILESNVENLEDYLIRKLPTLILDTKRYGVKKVTWVSIESRFKLYKGASDRVKEEFEKIMNIINDN